MMIDWLCEENPGFFQELEWGGGLKQRDNSEAEKEELSRIAAQPFARFEPDEVYMKELMLGQKKKRWIYKSLQGVMYYCQRQ